MKPTRTSRWMTLWPHVVIVLLLIFPSLNGVSGNEALEIATTFMPQFSNAYAQMKDEATACPCPDCVPTGTATSEPTETGTSEPTGTATSEPTGTATSEPTETTSATSEPTETTTSATTEPTTTSTSTTSEPTETITSTPTETSTSVPPVGSATANPSITRTSITAEPSETSTSEPTETTTATLTATATSSTPSTATLTLTTTPEATTTVQPSATSNTTAQATNTHTTTRIVQPTSNTVQRASYSRTLLDDPSASCGVATVDFANNIEVVQDRDGNDPQLIGEYADKCGGPDGIEWKQCEKGPKNEKQTKNWPVAYVKNSKITIAEATFKVPVKLKGAIQVVGKVTIGDVTLEWKAAATQVDTIVSAKNMIASKPLPNAVAALKPLIITWEITSEGREAIKFSSDHPVYVLLNAPLVTPNAKVNKPLPVYVTLADITTEAASGKKSAHDVVAAVWKQFERPLVVKGKIVKTIKRRDLNPETGKITPGATLQYYGDAWSFANEQNNTASKSRLDDLNLWFTRDLLKAKRGICSAWALLFADSLRIHGIEMEVLAIYPDKGLRLGAAVEGIDDEEQLDVSEGAQAMLIKTWTFDATKIRQDADAAFPYEFEYTPPAEAGGEPTVHHDGITHQAHTPGQNNLQPPGYFQNHVVVRYGERVYDPSYGARFPTMKRWIEGSLSGYAKSEQQNNRITIAACQLGRNANQMLQCGR